MYCCIYSIVLCFFYYVFFFFFKQKTAYEMRISDWSSDVCSSDLFEFSTPDTRGAVILNKLSNTDSGHHRIHDSLIVRFPGMEARDIGPKPIIEPGDRKSVV